MLVSARWSRSAARKYVSSGYARSAHPSWNGRSTAAWPAWTGWLRHQMIRCSAAALLPGKSSCSGCGAIGLRRK
eukprot:5726445-Pleurochrysis_carterae.AAC.1